MRSKGSCLIYTTFFIACLVVFLAINDSQPRVRSDGILVTLITIFSAFIVFCDFRTRLPTSKIIGPVLIFVLVNFIAIVIIFIAEISVSVAFVIPFFMVEGAFVYWLLEKRVSAFKE